MVNTSLKNKYKDYFILDEKDWHENKIGTYHVSSIGCGHEDDKHSGPCLRSTFYNYVNPIENSEETEGNFHVGRVLHKEAQDIYLKNHPHSIKEFPLGKVFGNTKIKIVGSVDIVEFIDGGMVDIVDFKTASDYTFPRHKDEYNKTHFEQVYIYSYWLQHYVFNLRHMKIRNIKVVYIAKHNLYVGEQVTPYDDITGAAIWKDFVMRSMAIHSHLTDKSLPPDEPMKWCKYCSYRHRCRDNVIFDDDIVEYTDTEIDFMYQKETGKSPIWRGKYTKAYLKYKEQFKVKI